MVSRDFQALSERRAERARELAGRYPAAREALEFLAEVAEFQAGVRPEAALESLPELLALTMARAPPPLVEAARGIDREICREAMEAYLKREGVDSPRGFFARVLLQPAWYGRAASSEGGTECPACGSKPQAAILRRQGDGQGLWLTCSLCFHEWQYPRGRCAGCGSDDERGIAYYRAEQIAHIQVMTCEGCRGYLHAIDLDVEPRAVSDIDEAAALALDVWAIERGFGKIQPNLVGI